MLFILAWRNLWRQKRRTFLTAFSLSLALFLSLMTRSFQEGSYAANIENSARFYTGLVQLQHPDYFDSNSIDDVLPQTDVFIEYAKQHANIERILPRVESVVLAALGDRSKGALVLGVDPGLEDSYSKISQKLLHGRYLQADERAVLIGEGLAQYLKAEIGDELVLYGQGYRGQTAAGLYQVEGILHFPLHSLDSQLVYMPIKAAQTLFSLEHQVTAWVFDVFSLHELQQTVADLSRHYHGTTAVKDWQTLSPEMAQQIVLDRAGGIFLVYVLYGVVGFGLFATILMMTLERQREFAVMLATGLSRIQLSVLLLIESSCVAILGVGIGLIITSPFIAYFYYNPIEITGDAAQVMLESGFEPIIPISTEFYLYTDQIGIVMAILLLCLIYPLYRVARLNVPVALKRGPHAR